MAKDKGMGSLHEGLEHRAPSSHDSSMAKKGGSVDSGATRDGPAKQPQSVGPRTA